jgi:deoxyhypusine synthase
MGIFKSFFDMMKGEPATIITDEQASIISAIEQLKQDGDFQGYHLLDTFHILRNVSKKSKNKYLLRRAKNTISTSKRRDNIVYRMSK